MRLEDLVKTINARAEADPSESWTAKLLSQGPEKCAEKFGEEAVELIVSCLSKGNKSIVHEAADTLYHLNLLIRSQNISIKTVLEELSKREGVSGLEEKENRGSKK